MGAAMLDGASKVLIVCDRGTIDNKAYMSYADYTSVLEELNLSEEQMFNEYDAVFHMTTAAKGAESAYTLSNNNARTETLEEAVALDDRLIRAWESHPHFRIINNEGSFEDKLMRLVVQIAEFLGEGEKFDLPRGIEG